MRPLKSNRASRFTSNWKSLALPAFPTTFMTHHPNTSSLFYNELFRNELFRNECNEDECGQAAPTVNRSSRMSVWKPRRFATPL
jgi:hypothetical protein